MTTPTPAQRHVETLRRMRDYCDGFPHLGDEHAALDYALAALEAAEAAGRRVIAAFEAHGKAKGVADDLSTRAECERAMVALAAAISAEREG